MFLRFSAALVIIVATIACWSSIGIASVIPPSGLAPASQYQLIFVTAGPQPQQDLGGTIFGTSTDIATYNAFVAAQAAINPSLPTTTWHAVVSTSAINANVNAPSNGLPVYNTHGELVAPAATGLYTSVLTTAIRYDQNGLTAYTSVNPAANLWTGSDTAGNAATPLGTATPTYGNALMTDSRWVNGSTYGATLLPLHLYALSGPITVVPEPSTSLLTGSAAVLVTFALRRRRTRQIGELTHS